MWQRRLTAKRAMIASALCVSGWASIGGAEPVAPLLPAQEFKSPADTTASQLTSPQLNQLFNFETTPSKTAAREGYLTAGFAFDKFDGRRKTFRELLQGEYGVTNQIAVGALIPVATTIFSETHTGVGDVTLFGQYKFDKIINPEVVNVTGQLDVVLPTGDSSERIGTGHFGVRPLLLAYKNFGLVGDGELSLYGVVGATFTTDSDFRTGLAATYEISRVAGVLEFFNTTGDRVGKPLLSIAPGIAFRQVDPWEFVVGFPVGLNNNTPRWGITLKLTYAFGQ